VAEDALLIIKKFLKKRVRDRLKMREIVVSALYLSMRRYKLDRPGLLEIFCEYASVDKSRAERAIKIIREILNINGEAVDENIDVEDEIVRRKIDEIKRFLRGYINMLINDEMKRICVETASTEILNMLREGFKKDLSMLNMLKSDRHIALTIIYMSSLVCKADISLRKLDVKEHLIQRPTANKYMRFIRRVLENVQSQRSPLIEQLFRKLDERRNRCP
jgi:transcription initiation factor TFIIIB Brf1 subunit/transcription initiation factor TFIIB